MQKHCFSALHPLFKKSPPVVWLLSDKSWHPQTHPSPGSTAFLTTEIIWGLFFFSPKIFLFHAVHSTAGCKIGGWVPWPPGWLDPADQLISSSAGAKKRR